MIVLILFHSPSEVCRTTWKAILPTNKKGRMVFGVRISDEDKQKYTKGLEYFDWVLEESEKNNNVRLL